MGVIPGSSFWDTSRTLQIDSSRGLLPSEAALQSHRGRRKSKQPRERELLPAELPGGSLRLPAIELMQCSLAVPYRRHGGLDLVDRQCSRLTIGQQSRQDRLRLTIPGPTIVSQMIDEVEELGLLGCESDLCDISRSARHVDLRLALLLPLRGPLGKVASNSRLRRLRPAPGTQRLRCAGASALPGAPFFVWVSALPAAALAAFDADLLPSALPAADAAFLLVLSAM